MKKVLFISTSFYPDPFVGSVRVKEFSKWLPDYGWKPYVLSKNYGFKVTKEDFEKNVSPEVSVIYLNSAPTQSSTGAEPRFREKIKALASRFLGRFILSPDPSVIFWRSVISGIFKIVKDVEPDLVITTGPPQSIHLVGIEIKRMFPDVAWISDFRDVYRVGGSYRTGVLGAFKHWRSLRWEIKTYMESDGIVCAIPEHIRWIRRLTPSASHKAKLITNGAPAEFFDKSIRVGTRCSSEYYKVSVVGFSQCIESLYLSEAIAKVNGGVMRIDLFFVGIEPSNKRQIVRALPNNSFFLGPVSHDKAVAEIMGSDILVALLSKERSRQFNLTSKLFEYCATGRPVLVVNPTRPDRRLFGKLPGVWMVNEASSEKIHSTIKEILDTKGRDYQERVSYFERNFSRREQTRVLGEFMDEVIGL